MDRGIDVAGPIDERGVDVGELGERDRYPGILGVTEPRNGDVANGVSGARENLDGIANRSDDLLVGDLVKVLVGNADSKLAGRRRVRR